MLLDVRTQLSGARHIPYDQLVLFLEKIKLWNKPIITYSTYGRRSKIAASLLSKSNINVIDGSKITELEELLFGCSYTSAHNLG